jgi:hypothetical protein
MGARNVVAAYHRWAGKVPPLSMQLLIYMAVVAKDSDDWPWYGQGQAALAEFAMGRSDPDETDRRAVGRAMTPLLNAGAVTVERAATQRSDGNSTARYRLNLDDAADAARRAWEDSPSGQRRTSDTRRKAKPQDGKRPMGRATQDQSHRTESDRVIGRFVASHRTESDEPQDGNRRTKEKEKTKRSEKTEEEAVDLPAAVTLPREPSAAPRTAPVVEIFPGAATRPPIKMSRAQQAIAEATANREAARRAYRQEVQ